MNIECILGFHTWDGCKCTLCGKTRNKQHDWNKNCEKCFICGKIRENQHKWDVNCERCSLCKEIRDKHHIWNGCICSKCFQLRDEQHNWDGCKCTQCGKKRDEQHDWSKDCEKCSRCGKTRNEQHDWSKDCEKCSRCDKTLTYEHKFENGFCSKCGKEQKVEDLFLDDRDGKKYKTIRIGNKIWLAENFAFEAKDGCWCYSGNFYYNWVTAINVCPKGWHLPSREEFIALLKNLGNDENNICKALSSEGESGFSALFCGYRYYDGKFLDYGQFAGFWSCSLSSEKDSSNGDSALSWTMNPEHPSDDYCFTVPARVHLFSMGKRYGLSVRYIRN
jgi:uncharacterized protein (TIGR02145 family)